MKLPVATLALSIVTLAAAPAFAATDVTLSFEGATSFASVADFYSGGTDGAGASGTDFGLSFSGAALALKNDELGPYFSGAPSPDTVMFGAGDSAVVLNAPLGIIDKVTFFYATETDALSSVKVYSGLDGSGSLLASIAIGNAQIGCTAAPYCRFDFTTAKFDGVARSVSFGSNPAVAFDDISVTTVPEASTTAMLFAGLGVVGLLARRRRHSQA